MIPNVTVLRLKSLGTSTAYYHECESQSGLPLPISSKAIEVEIPFTEETRRHLPQYLSMHLVSLDSVK